MRLFLGFRLIASILFFNTFIITEDMESVKILKDKAEKAKRFEELLLHLMDIAEFINTIENPVPQEEVSRVRESVKAAENFLSTLKITGKEDEAEIDLHCSLNEMIIMLIIDPITKLIVAGRLYKAYLSNIILSKELEVLNIDNDIKLKLKKMMNSKGFDLLELKNFLRDISINKAALCESNKNLIHYTEASISNFRSLIETILSIISIPELKEVQKVLLKLCNTILEQKSIDQKKVAQVNSVTPPAVSMDRNTVSQQLATVT